MVLGTLVALAVILGAIALLSEDVAERDFGATDILVGLVLLVVAAVFYMLPALIAVQRKHRQALPLAIINFFLGWTYVGWVGCLAWAFQSFETR